MPYMLLINEPTGQREARGRVEGEKVYARMLDFAATLQARGVLQAAQSLAGLEQATKVQVRDGQPRWVDGPFAEVKEMVGGYFLVDVPTREEALAIAAACPAAEWATIEVRNLGPCFHDLPA
ncbi:YciI family protein [Ideonella azotifigens]|uniref:YciI family protein n=1 Tax=Ideonella azotifigens TaxID=513160 RepID=A0ABN1JPS7_9BURK|nr:YciI family protein [Ideonella azotifigens]MCD2340107.1 YciI family protein [Ideonella azotifigens]